MIEVDRMEKREEEAAKEWYSPAEFGQKLSLSHDTIQRECERGRIRAFQTPGGYWRIPHEELLRYTGFRRNLMAMGCKT